MEKSCRKFAPEATVVPNDFLNLVNNPKQPSHARNCFKNTIF